MAFAAAILGLFLPCTVPAHAVEDAAATMTELPDAPYTRWLYGLDGSRSPNGAPGLQSGTAGRFGTPADGMPYEHEISLQPDIRTVTVTHNETVKFVTPDGQEFRWKFDTPRTVVSLSRIAPLEMPLSSNVAVFVTRDPLERG